MTDSLKDLIIVILSVILVYLIYKKLNKTTQKVNKRVHHSNKHVQHLNNNYANCNSHIREHINEHNNYHQEMNNYDQNIDDTEYLNNNHNELLSINSNSVSDDIVVSNISNHELVHIDDSKPFLSNEELSISNHYDTEVVECLTYLDFNYTKDFEEDFDYYDPEIYN